MTYSLEEILDPHMSAALFANETLYSMLNPRERNSSGLATRLSFFTTNTGSGRQALSDNAEVDRNEILAINSKSQSYCRSFFQ